MALLRLLIGLAVVAQWGFSQGTPWIPLFDGTSLKGWTATEFRGHGEVAVKDGAIQLGKGTRMTGITWSGGDSFPQTSYEIRYEARKIEGSDFFATLTFPVGKSFCTWINGGWGGHMVGLSSLDDMDASENDTSTERDFEPGRWYAFRLEVKPDRIRGWIDGTLIIDADLKGRQVALRPGDTDLSTPLGFATYKTSAALRRIEYRRL